MDYLIYYLARAVVALIQRLPLPWVARLGRAGGALAFLVDRRHRRVALGNLGLCFGHEKGVTEIHELARENFCRIGENYACAIKTAAMSAEELRPFVELVAPEEFRSRPVGQKPPSIVVAIGHFGNFELYARFSSFIPGYQTVTTYRGLRQPLLNDLLQRLREQSGCIFFERRFEAAQLKSTMNQPGILLGLLADQHAGPNGLRLPFLGHTCSTSAAPALFALRYDCPLYTGFCFRVGLGKWRLEAGRQIQVRQNGIARSTADIMAEVNLAFEEAVRRDPPNWFWVHKRWKQARRADLPVPTRSADPTELTEAEASNQRPG
jgi:Kdo2-lipid IVA lauroyltransferase/acyltransferase